MTLLRVCAMRNRGSLRHATRRGTWAQRLAASWPRPRGHDPFYLYLGVLTAVAIVVGLIVGLVFLAQALA